MLRKNFPARKAQRRKEAKERQEERNKLTPEQQLAKLDDMFGKDQGAKKERTKLLNKINK